MLCYAMVCYATLCYATLCYATGLQRAAAHDFPALRDAKGEPLSSAVAVLAQGRQGSARDPPASEKVGRAVAALLAGVRRDF